MKSNYSSRQHVKLYGLILLATSLLMLSGCAGPSGRLNRDAEVTKWFTTNSVPKEYSYFYNGHSNQPYAIIGLQPEYEQVSTFWDRVEPSTEEFARMVRWVYVPNADEVGFSPEGAHILDPNGKRIGIWFSSYPFTTIRFRGENQVEVMSPYRSGNRGDAF